MSIHSPVIFLSPNTHATRKELQQKLVWLECAEWYGAERGARQLCYNDQWILANTHLQKESTHIHNKSERTM